MSYSNTYNETQTFTATHAKHLAAKVATDLKRLQRFYGKPTDNAINKYEAEIIELLKEGYLNTVTYGFKREGKWIEPTVKYNAKDLNDMATSDDDPGKVHPGANISGASFYSFLTYSNDWFELSESEKEEFKSQLPINRSSASEPRVDGHFNNDLTYSSGGRSLNRSSVKSY